MKKPVIMMKKKGMYDNAEIMSDFDVAVIGGGLAGICAAIAAARKGARTVLVHDRSVLGGNASSEIRVRISGASCGGWLPNAREEGIAGEIVEKSIRFNPENREAGISVVMWELCRQEKNLSLFLDTCVYEVEKEGRIVKSARAVQLSTEKRYKFKAAYFIDASGDGIVAAAAGAAYRIGFEAKSEYGETLAPDKANNLTMGASLGFQAEDMGHSVPFVRPEWAYHYPDDDALPFKLNFVSGAKKGGFAWIEYGGIIDSVRDTQEMREELLKCLFGVWDHLKNTPGHDMENYQLTWIGMAPGKREGRRFTGEYVLTEKDLRETNAFEDAVAYGGWPIDIHDPEGFKGRGIYAFHGMLDWIYSIPMRCLYSRDFDNLWLAGRTISVSKIAFGSTRIMGTLGICGEAAGYAAGLAVKKKQTCSRTAKQDYQEVQQAILKNGGYIPWKKNEDGADLALAAKAKATSEAACELISVSEFLELDRPRGVMFPVTADRIDAVELLLKNTSGREIVLAAKLRKAVYPGDFYQEEILAEAQASVAPGTGWVAFRFDRSLAPGLYWVSLPAAKNAGWAANREYPVGVYFGEQNLDELKKLAPFFPPGVSTTRWMTDTNASDGLFDANGGFLAPAPGRRKTGWTRNAVWHAGNQNLIKLPCPCFKIFPSSNAYAPEMIINGINRPEVFPNLWISDPEKGLPQSLALKWEKAQRFNSVHLIFDNDIDAFRPPVKPRPVTVKD
ncbi:MAG: FAD-dependent oxidoreductase, partial [Kiritimatiellae bacterium]|nr:FAD-dependent oxidoreductase [Kiritimatiellia bacterium]